MKVVLRDVSVVSPSGEVLRDHAVVIDGERIAGVAPSLAVPSRPNDIACDGAFVVPGLADMHVHHWDATEADLYLANGVTTVRNMFGAPYHLALRGKYDRGEIRGPRLVTATPIADGATASGKPMWPGSALVRDVEQARLFVDACVERGYEQVKVYSFLRPEALEALGRAAAAAGVRMVGHCPDAVGFEAAIDHGLTCIEHLTAIAVGHLRAGIEQPDSSSVSPIAQLRVLTAHLDLDAIRVVARRCADEQIWNCPTLVVRRGMATTAADRRGDPTLGYVPATTMASWNPANDFRLRDVSFAEFADALLAWQDRLEDVTRILHEEGAPLLAGTDNPNPWVVPGFSLHDELARLVSCGLSPLEALRTATSEPARFLGETGNWGVVQPGARADLVLCTNDPLRDIGALRRPHAVVHRGRFLDRDGLDAMLERRMHAVRAAAAPDPPDLPTCSSTTASAGVLRTTLGGTHAGCCRFRHVHSAEEVDVEEAEVRYDAGAEPSLRHSRLTLRPDGTVAKLSVRVDSGAGTMKIELDRDGQLDVTEIDGRHETSIVDGAVVPTDRVSQTGLALALSMGQQGTLCGLDLDDTGAVLVPLTIASDDEHWTVGIEREASSAELNITLDADGIPRLSQDTWMGLLVSAPVDPH